MRHWMILSVAPLVGLAACGDNESIDSESQTLQAIEEWDCAGDGGTGRGTKTEFVANGLWDPFGVLGAPVGQIVSGGEVRCPGNEPTGNPLAPCPPDSAVHRRGFTLVDRVIGSDRRVTGWVTITSNLNLDAAGGGPAWGRFIASGDAGEWRGIFAGKRSPVEQGCSGAPCWLEHIVIVGCGTAGDVDGMHLHATEDIWTYQLTPVFFVSTFEGVILDP